MTVILRTRGVTKHFAGITALSEVDIDIDEGERVGLIGPNGAGKTTFFNCILGITAPDTGTVELADEDVTRMPVHQRADRGIGRTFQRIELFPDSSVRDHLIVADRVRRGERRLLRDLVARSRSDDLEVARCDEVLDLLGIADLADEPIERLSLGQGRLVEVARALMTQPRLLLLDEPSSGLDRRETAALAETLRRVQAEHGFAILLVEHDIELVASFTQRTFLLDFGRMVLHGPTSEVMGSDMMRQAYLGDLEVSS